MRLWLYLIVLNTFEKRLRILPNGVVSKKVMGERRIRESIVPCNSEAAFKVPTETITVPIMMKTACKNKESD